MEKWKDIELSLHLFPHVLLKVFSNDEQVIHISF